jgi:hypothetical protein
MPETRITPEQEKAASRDRRDAQAYAFRRNQAFVLIALAAFACLWWLFHGNLKWIFTPGWWRL